MFREFNVKFEDVEMLGGADNLLEGTEITKVIVRGDNNKMSSLDSMLKNCNELDTIDGELDLNGVSDIDNLLEGTELVKSIDLKNINNENITANNSFPHVDRINIGGELYNKKAMQNVIASKDWTFDNITYNGTVGDNIVTKEVNIVDDNKATIQDTLEQKAKGIEIIGQTYENLVVGSGEVTLLDELTLESVDGSPNEFNPHLEQPVCVESIEGETYQNLIEGKGEYKLTDTFSTTWTESNNSIENPPSMIEIPEIFGNTVQGYANVVTSKQVVDSIVNSGVDVNTKLNDDGTFTVDIHAITSPTDSTNFIQLKANTTYSLRCYRFNSTQIVNVATYHGDNPTKVVMVFQGGSFTTDSSGKVLFFPQSVQDRTLYLRCVEGQVNLSQYDYDEMDLNYIQSVGDLYVDESGEPILDEEGNEQYKLDILSYDYKYMPETSDNRTGLSDATKDGYWSVINHNIGDYTRYSTTNKTINRADYGDLVYASFKIVKLDNRKFNHLNFCTRTGGYTYHFMTKNEYNDLPVNVEHFQSTIQSESHPDGIILDMSFCEYSKELEFSCKVKDIVLVNLTKWFGKGNEPTREWCDENIKYVEHEDGEILYGNKNKTTILMPCPLNRVKVSNNNYYEDKLYYDTKSKKYLISKRTKDIIASDLNWVSQRVDDNGVVGRTSSAVSDIHSFMYFSGLSYSNSNIWQMTDGCYMYSNSIYACVPITYGVTNFDEFKSWIKDRKIILATNSTQTVETKILEKPSLETYSPKTYITTNTEIQPSQMTITNKRNLIDLRKIKSNTDYTLQLKCNEKGNKPIKINLCGKEKDIDATIGVNHVNITTNELNDNKLELSGKGNIVSEIIVVEGEMNQYPEYFNGVQSTGELQDDGTYKIDITTENEFKNINLWDGKKVSDYATDFIEIYDNTFSLNSYDAYITEYDADRQLVTREYITSTANKVLTAKNSNCKYITVRSNIFKETDTHYVKEGLLVLSNRMVSFKEKPTGFRNSLKVLISSNSPLAKGDKLYWNKSNKRYEIDRNGVIEVPVVEGDVIDLPRLYQRDGTNINISTGNIKPAKTKIVYKDII